MPSEFYLNSKEVLLEFQRSCTLIPKVIFELPSEFYSSSAGNSTRISKGILLEFLREYCPKSKEILLDYQMNSTLLSSEFYSNSKGILLEFHREFYSNYPGNSSRISSEFYTDSAGNSTRTPWKFLLELRRKFYSNLEKFYSNFGEILLEFRRNSTRVPKDVYLNSARYSLE